MKDFLRRLKYYGFGFGIGLLFVVFFFKNRGCSWSPSNRVKDAFNERVLVLPDTIAKELKRKGISTKEIIAFLNEGDVDFNGSKKTGNPKVYAISHEVKGKTETLWFSLPKNSFISEVALPNGDIQAVKNSVRGTASMISFPKAKNIIFLDSNKVLTCQQEYLGMIAPAQFTRQLKETGSIDFGRSDFNAKPFAVQYIRFKGKKKEKIEASVTWFQDHIRFDQLILEDSVDCSLK